MSIDLTELTALFFEEADEHLATLESTLLGLEKTPDDDELVNLAFRAAHSIKGGSGTVGLERVMQFTHALEGLLERMRGRTMKLTAPTAALLLRAKDVLGGLLASARDGTEHSESVDTVLAELTAAAGQSETRAEAPRARQSSGERAIRVFFRPSRDLMKRGMDPLLVVRDLADAGRVDALELDTTALPDLDALEPDACYVAWTIVLRTAKSDAEIRDVFAFVEDASEITITPVADEPAPAEAPAANRASPAAPAQRRATLRVDTDKIDKLVDLVGELVIAQSMVASALGDGSPDGARRLREAVGAVDRNTRELQDRVMAIRMVPIGTVFNRFPRVVRDLAATLGKEIDLVIEGDEIELDKGVVERLADPLTHVVRNALDHGVEPGAERVAANKPARGTIAIRAFHESGCAVIEVSDDGRGLQTERIRKKARALGLVAPDAEPTVEELHALIFAPGFSTAEVVSDVSGRGVGMDVVKRNVEALNGSIDFTSEPGKGSRMHIRLPLTLAIMDGLSLRIGAQVFVLPLAAIVESFRPTRNRVRKVLGHGEVVDVRDSALPLVRLHESFGVEGAETDPCNGLVCVVEAGAARLGFLVDDVLGQAQVVVKTLETNYRRVDGVMGATILGDGRVALILDVQAIARRTSRAKELDHATAHHAA